MVVGAAAEWPEKLAVGFLDGQVVDAGEAAHHVAVLVEFPVLVAIRAVPLSGIVMPFVGEAHGDAVAGTGPQIIVLLVFLFVGFFVFVFLVVFFVFFWVFGFFLFV